MRYNFSTTQHLVNLIKTITHIGFENSHTEFGGFFYPRMCGLSVSNLGCIYIYIYFSDLDVGASTCAYIDIQHIIRKHSE